MKVRTIDEAFETPAQRTRRLVETYARRGWGVDDIRVALRRQHDVRLGRDAVKAVLTSVLAQGKKP